VSGAGARAAAAAAAAFLLAGCDSPEAERVRGGGRGADTGNRGRVVEMHEGSVIYYQTPCVTTLPRCTGPLPARTALQTSRRSR